MFSAPSFLFWRVLVVGVVLVLLVPLVATSNTFPLVPPTKLDHGGSSSPSGRHLLSTLFAPSAAAAASPRPPTSLPTLLAATTTVDTAQTSTLVTSTTSRRPRTTTDPNEWIRRCPCRVCESTPGGDEYRIVCDVGGLAAIPVLRMEPRLTLIEIDAPDDRHNNLTLGPLFYRFSDLHILRVRRSNVPAIGRTTFRWRVPLAELDLTLNNLTFLEAGDFQGLRQLRKLELGHNQLRDLPSGVFHHLNSLVSLNLSHNQLHSITTRLFYNLTSLQSLDLSHNPLGDFAPQNALDLWPLRRLYLAGCQLRMMHALFYRNLPALELLDLRHNQLEVLHRQEFRYLKKLTVVRLDGNRLRTLPAMTFHNNHLEHLGLGANQLQELAETVFANASIVELCLSHNNLSYISPEVLRPLKASLRRLDLEGAGLLGRFSRPGSARYPIAALLSPLQRLESLNLANLSLSSGSGLGDDENAVIFGPGAREHLRVLNISHNHLVNISAQLVGELVNLQVLDLAGNNFYELSGEFLYALKELSNLTTLRLEDNPWSCFRCHLLALLHWLHAHPQVYLQACEADEQLCATCQYPGNLVGAKIHLLEEAQLEWCTDPSVQLRRATTEPNVGLVLALLIIIIMIIVIVAVIIYYRNRGAIYFTNEDLVYPHPSSGFGSGGGGGGGGGGTDSQHLHPDDNKSVATNESRVYNVSSAIRYFADATAAETPGGSLRSVDSFSTLGAMEARLHQRHLSAAQQFHHAQQAQRGSNGGPRRGQFRRAPTGVDRRNMPGPPPPLASVSIDSTSMAGGGRYRTESSDLSAHIASNGTNDTQTEQDKVEVRTRRPERDSLESKKSNQSRAKKKSLERLEMERKKSAQSNISHRRKGKKNKAKKIKKGEASFESDDEDVKSSQSKKSAKRGKGNGNSHGYQRLERSNSKTQRSSSSVEATNSAEVVADKKQKKPNKTAQTNKRAPSTPHKVKNTKLAPPKVKPKIISSSSSSSSFEDEEENVTSAHHTEDEGGDSEHHQALVAEAEDKSEAAPPEHTKTDTEEEDEEEEDVEVSLDSVNSLPAALSLTKAAESDEDIEGDEEEDEDSHHHLKVMKVGRKHELPPPSSEEEEDDESSRLEESTADKDKPKKQLSVTRVALSPTSEEESMTAAVAEAGGEAESSIASDDVGST